MDPNTLLSLSGSAGSDNNDAGLCNKLWMLLLTLLILPAVCFSLYLLFTIVLGIGRTKFSIEPIVYTGLDSIGRRRAAVLQRAAVPPSFNVTLRAESTRWAKFCSGGPAAMEVAYAGMTIAMADAEPFCVDPREEKLITVTVSPGWPVLPAFLQDRMDTDRRLGGGVQLELGFAFSRDDDDGLPTWVRCRTTLDHTQASPCNSYFLKVCGEGRTVAFA